MPATLLTTDLRGLDPAEFRVRATSHSVAEWGQFAPVWDELAAAGTGFSIFLSRAWIDAWLETFALSVDPYLLVFHADRYVVGASLLIKSEPSLARPLRRMSLNAAGENTGDSTYVEFNDVLAYPGWESSVAGALAGHVLQQDWDEFQLDGFCDGPAMDELRRALTGTPVEETWKPSYYVDLAALRASDSTYLQALHARQRKHIQQNLRYHAELGALVVQQASSSVEALEMLDELAALNRCRRKMLGQSSVFGSQRFVAFHRSFISKTFAAGNVQFLRVTAGAEPVGLVYNLVDRGKVSFYQCGYNYTGHKRLRPGIVTLAVAIQYCLEQGFKEFDFLAGDEPYKACLSTGSRALAWATFRRSSARVWVHGVARGIRNTLRTYARGVEA